MTGKTSARCEKKAQWGGGGQRRLGFLVLSHDFGFYPEWNGRYFEHGSNNKYICLLAALAALVAVNSWKRDEERPVRKLRRLADPGQQWWE